MRDLEPDTHGRHAVLHFMFVGKTSASGDWKPGLGIPVAERVIREDRRLLHHDGGAARDTRVDVPGDPEFLSGLKVDPRVIGLHFPVDRARKQTPCQDRVFRELGLFRGRQLVGFG